MERRNFFKIAPFGLAGIAALATNPLNEEPTGSSVLKAKQLTIRGADGKDYHPLVVEAAATTHDEVPHALPELLSMPSERFRITSDGLGISPANIKFFSNGAETFSL
jgi:hypothetical protein